MSVTFCVGNIGIKRRSLFKVEPNSILADNDDVLLSFTLGGKLYCAQGSIPYSNLTVREFVAFNCALRYNRPLNDKEIKYMLNSCGLKVGLYKRMSTLSRVQYRHVCVAAKLEIDTKKIKLNFDGLNYTRRHSKQLNALMKNLNPRFEVLVSVTDMRFIPPFAHTRYFSKDGEGEYTGAIKTSAIASRRCMLKEMKVRNLPLNKTNVKRVIEVR